MPLTPPEGLLSEELLGRQPQVFAPGIVEEFFLNLNQICRGPLLYSPEDLMCQGVVNAFSSTRGPLLYRPENLS